jgi:hypothetical protein
VSAPRGVAEASSVDAGGRCTDAAGDVSAVWCDSYGSEAGSLGTTTSCTGELDPEPGTADRPPGAG